MPDPGAAETFVVDLLAHADAARHQVHPAEILRLFERPAPVQPECLRGRGLPLPCPFGDQPEPERR